VCEVADDALIPTWISGNVTRILGYEVDHCLGDPNWWQDRVHPEDRDHTRKSLSELRLAENSSHEYRFRHDDGSYIWIEDKREVATDVSGTPVEVVGTWTDITERKRVEEALRESEAQFRNMVDNVPGIVYRRVLHADGRTTFPYISHLAHKVWFNPESVKANPVLVKDIIHRDDQELWQNSLQKSASDLSVLDVELRVELPSGEVKWAHAIARPHLRDNGDIVWDGVAIDVTERRRAQEQIEASLSQKEVLLQEIHHRVRNNLQVISSVLSLQANLATESSVVNALRESQRRVSVMARVHNSLLHSDDLALINAKDYLNTLIDDISVSFELDPRRIALHTELDEITLDTERAITYGQILSELLANCAKHAFPNGRSGVIEVALRRLGEGRIELVVADDGVGLPEGFDWHRAKTLGPRLVGALVDKMHGELTIDRSRGTRFQIVFSEDP